MEDRALASQVLTGRKRRLTQDGLLFDEVARRMRLGWSLEQIAGRRKRVEAGVEQRSGVSAYYEAIYTAIYALVERRTRFVVLVLMPTRKVDVVACAFASALNAIPEPLRKTLTYDRGKEMVHHESLTLTTNMRIFFAHPHLPWQRGANENKNGQLRQYFRKGTSLSGYDQDDLDTWAESLHDRLWKTLDFATPKSTSKHWWWG